jgi:Velvet factor
MVCMPAISATSSKSDRQTDVGYFVFQDLSVRKEGDFRLKFSLFELQRSERSFFLFTSLSD